MGKHQVGLAADAVSVSSPSEVGIPGNRDGHTITFAEIASLDSYLDPSVISGVLTLNSSQQVKQEFPRYLTPLFV